MSLADAAILVRRRRGAFGVVMALALAGGDVTAETAHPPEASVPHVLRVGAGRALKRIGDAMRLAKDGDTVEVDGGTYVGDVGVWRQSRLTIRAPGDRAHVVQGARAADGKGIWVVKGDDVLIENFEFSGAAVPDRNGAGIRHEGGRLTVRECVFRDNEMGLLTWNDGRAELVIERSEFHDNRATTDYRPGDPLGHQVYVGAIRRFTIRESYVHHGAFGHLVKTRARENHVVNNRLTDEAGGRASYELEFPAGGIAYVVGNIIEQSAGTENLDLVSYGAEGYRWVRNELFLAFNTLVDDSAGGTYVRVRGNTDRVVAVNNLLLGPGALSVGAAWEIAGNVRASPGDVPRAASMDYRLARESPLVGAAVERAAGEIPPLVLAREYAHPRSAREVPHGPQSPGAQQDVVE